MSSKDAVFTQNVGEKKKGPATHESISRNFLFIFELQRKATFQILKIQITFAKLVKFPYSLIFCLLKLVLTWTGCKPQQFEKVEQNCMNFDE